MVSKINNYTTLEQIRYLLLRQKLSSWRQFKTDWCRCHVFLKRRGPTAGQVGRELEFGQCIISHSPAIFIIPRIKATTRHFGGTWLFRADRGDFPNENEMPFRRLSPIENKKKGWNSPEHSDRQPNNIIFRCRKRRIRLRSQLADGKFLRPPRLVSV